MWATIVPAAFFAWVLVYGIYLGVTGKQAFTFENSPPEQSESAE